jgi:outer membrane protein
MAARFKTTMLAMCLCTAFAGAAQAADVQLEHQLDQARALLREGRAAAAYTLLEPQEFARAGDIQFDTLLGIAALDAGKPDKATLAFERVLALDPGAAGVRLDMARAYFALGDYPRARQELDSVAQNDPPPAARIMIAKYLTAIAERERVKRTNLTAYVEGFAGNDDNVTSVVGDFSNAVLATYNLPGFQPTGNAVMRSSAIAGAAAGLEVTHQLSDAVTLSAGADLRRRTVLDAPNYTSDQLDLRVAASYTADANMYRVGMTAQDYRQRTDVPSADRNALGLNVEWRHTFGAADQGSLFGVATRQRFPDIAVNDINSIAVGAGWLHLFDSARKPLLYATVLSGQDNALNQLANGADNGKRFINGRLYGQLALSEKTDLFASTGLLYRSDRSAFARSTMAAYGNDHLTDLTLGLNWRPATDWTVRPQLVHTDNRSNIALSEYRRTEISVAVRYELH